MDQCNCAVCLWKVKVKVKSLSHVRLFATPWTVAHQAPLSMGILQARILEWVAMPSSRGSSQPKDRTQVSLIAGRFFTVWANSVVNCLVVSDSLWPHGLQPNRLLRPWDFPSKSTGVGCHCLLWNKNIIDSNWNPHEDIKSIFHPEGICHILGKTDIYKIIMPIIYWHWFKYLLGLSLEI